MQIIPAPRSVTMESADAFTLAHATRVKADIPSLQPVVDWFIANVKRLAGIDLVGSGNGKSGITLTLGDVDLPGMDTFGTRVDTVPIEAERHVIRISKEGITITGVSPEGVFRGATTLLHLITATVEDGSRSLTATTISDAPRFAWRGLSLDVVRTFHPVSTVKNVIDLLALYKMNVLHLHLTDAEGWRFEVPEYPELTGVSGKTAKDDRPGGFYTQTDYESILQYATSRFVTIILEFDSPGHTASVLRAYPALGSAEMHSAAETMRYLDPTIPGVWDLVTAVYAEMSKRHHGVRIHIGGDEAIAMDEAAFASYMDKAMATARGTSSGIVAWQETARAGFSEGDLMQWWIPPHLVEKVRYAAEHPDEQGFGNFVTDSAVRDGFIKLFLHAPEDLPKALSQGADVIISRADKLYLDTKYPEPSSDAGQEADHQRVGLPQVVYGNGTVEDSYDWNPATFSADLPLGRIAGIEAAIWCETILDEHDLMMQLLPRLPGVAEKAWSDEREWEDYLPRLVRQRPLWDAMGVNYFVSSVVWPKG